MTVQVVEKSWGREVVRVNTDLYCFKELHVAAGQRCSLHHHVRKDETFTVAWGHCLLEVGGELQNLSPGDTIRIFPGTRHRFGSHEGCVIHEVSTHHDDADVVRHEPSGPIPPNWGEASGELTPEAAAALRGIRTTVDQRVVLATGCFDMLHAGHVDFLRRAKQFGDFLVVAINSDTSVRRLKGEGRPIMSEKQRAIMLLNSRPVDYVVVFDADVPRCVAEALKPDVVVKGDDWRGRPVPEAEGAVLMILPETIEQRTTAIVDLIRGQLA